MGLNGTGLRQSIQEDNYIYSPEDLTARSPDTGETAIHDGSGIYSASLCFENSGSWYNVIDGSTM